MLTYIVLWKTDLSKVTWYLFYMVISLVDKCNNADVGHCLGYHSHFE